MKRITFGIIVLVMFVLATAITLSIDLDKASESVRISSCFPWALGIVGLIILLTSDSREFIASDENNNTFVKNTPVGSIHRTRRHNEDRVYKKGFNSFKLNCGVNVEVYRTDKIDPDSYVDEGIVILFESTGLLCGDLENGYEVTTNTGEIAGSCRYSGFYPRVNIYKQYSHDFLYDDGVYIKYIKVRSDNNPFSRYFGKILELTEEEGMKIRSQIFELRDLK